MFAKQDTPNIPAKWRNWLPKCANPNCARKSLLQTFAHRHHGMNVDGHWYCGPDCFEHAIKGKIGELMTSQGKPAKARSSRVPIGLLLLQRGVLTADQLRVALERHRLSEMNFGDVVQELGFATPEQVTAAVAAQWSCPVFPLGDRRLELGVRIPRQFLELYGMLPVHYGELERRLLIGFVSGVQHQVLYTIGHMTSCVVAPCFITAREYELHLHSPSTPFVRDDELLFDKIVDSAEMAHITRSYVVQLAADRVRLGKCRDYIWTRIAGRKREMDLLFRVRSD
jgi:Type II secretion system (T2SS), protein E, N-terminal domain